MDDALLAVRAINDIEKGKIISVEMLSDLNQLHIEIKTKKYYQELMERETITLANEKVLNLVNSKAKN